MSNRDGADERTTNALLSEAVGSPLASYSPESDPDFVSDPVSFLP